MADPAVERLELFARERTSARMTAISARLLGDAEFREEFVRSPNEALGRIGIEVTGDIKLSDRDRAILQMIGDNRVIELYQNGRFSELQRHISDTYSVLHPGQVAGDVAADFDVLVEAEAVAVAVVAIAAIVVGFEAPVIEAQIE
jgi:hypothetical protein